MALSPVPKQRSVCYGFTLHSLLSCSHRISMSPCGDELQRSGLQLGLSLLTSLTHFHLPDLRLCRCNQPPKGKPWSSCPDAGPLFLRPGCFLSHQGAPPPPQRLQTRPCAGDSACRHGDHSAEQRPGPARQLCGDGAQPQRGWNTGARSAQEGCRGRGQTELMTSARFWRRKHQALLRSPAPRCGGQALRGEGVGDGMGPQADLL